MKEHKRRKEKEYPLKEDCPHIRSHKGALRDKACLCVCGYALLLFSMEIYSCFPIQTQPSWTIHQQNSHKIIEDLETYGYAFECQSCKGVT